MNNVKNSDHVKGLLKLDRSCVPFLCDGRYLQNVVAAELNINMYYFIPFLFMVLPCELEYSDII